VNEQQFNQRRLFMTKTKGFLLTAGLVLAITFTLSCSSDDGDGGGGGVSYGGQKYKTVKIGEQTWFAENLNYAGDDNSIGRCYGRDPANCAKYGRLYTRREAMAACPDGWHLPTRAEWEVMTAYIGGENTEGKKLKAKSGWNDNNGVSGNGTDEYSFSALPGGYTYDDGADPGGGVGDSGYWWSARENDSAPTYYRRMNYNDDKAYWYEYSNSRMHSVRCLQD
jgi:uncharacterized protein (TIGR02145 family)